MPFSSFDPVAHFFPPGPTDITAVETNGVIRYARSAWPRRKASRCNHGAVPTNHDGFKLPPPYTAMQKRTCLTAQAVRSAINGLYEYMTVVAGCSTTKWLPAKAAKWQRAATRAAMALAAMTGREVFQ